MNNQDIIKSIFTNPKTGFKSVLNTYKEIKTLHPNLKITKKQVEEFISNQSVSQIHKQQKIPIQEFNQIKAPSLGMFQCDLIDVSNYKGYNSGFRYILIVVDIYSRFCFMEPITNKTSIKVLETFNKIHKKIIKNDVKIYSMYSDKGSEFKQIQKELPDTKFFFKNVDNHRGTGLIDNRIKFFRELLEKYLTHSKNLKWVDVVESLCDNINNTINRNTKHKAVDIWNRKEKNEQEFREPPKTYKVGDSVRIRTITDKFTKSSTGRFSNKIYKIVETDGLGYFLEGLTKKYFNVDLMIVKGGKDLNEIDKLRNKNKKNNTIKRKLKLFLG